VSYPLSLATFGLDHKATLNYPRQLEHGARISSAAVGLEGHSMRIVCFLLITATTLVSGCAARIARSGTDLTPLKSKEEIHAKLGKPVRTGIEESQFFEEYRTHRKIADPNPFKYFGPGYAMAVILTCGLCEPICVAGELCRVSRQTVLGQTVRVTYDSTGSVTNIYLDGESLFEWFPGGVPPSRALPLSAELVPGDAGCP
jgi:hypothetical protein